MAHNISAVLLKGAYDESTADGFDLKPVVLNPTRYRITCFPLSAEYCDHWSVKLKIDGDRAEEPLLNANVVHHMILAIADEPLFAVIETDYFGGIGTQCAAVYRGREEVMVPRSSEGGSINKALGLLGVCPERGLDEFDTVGLGQYRSFDETFKAYWAANADRLLS